MYRLLYIEHAICYACALIARSLAHSLTVGSVWLRGERKGEYRTKKEEPRTLSSQQRNG